ncbi:arylsulfatase [Methanofollis fontis]|uniref:Arylsulfatase n=1 Tax=Methanofollis fontis TaxID=2052832 RepID=A0A483CRM1_9EURY|nr:arylsulfatase [Methanofollis fontis]TAJ45468.1 arylsulfatase [Methanofollis fontis]
MTKRVREYRPGSAFPGVIGRTVDESTPAWPAPLRAKQGAPDVIVIVLDDTGFGHLGCYGSPIRTPNLDRLAAEGLLYTNMHTTALCSPTRSCILTGRNHHSNNMAGITEISTGYPGYTGVIPFENGFLPEMLLRHGYATFAIGKWHLTPAEQTSAAGPYDRWPLGRGFERFYGFLGGDTHQYYPELVYDNHQVDPPKTPEEGYTLNEDLADTAIRFIADTVQVAPDRPFFLYYCTGAMHAPHHVPEEWSDRYRGAFDDGWEAYREQVFRRQVDLGIVPEGTEMAAHDPDVPRWEDLPAEERRLYARMMEVFAGFLEQTDHHIGRIIDYLETIGRLENAIIMVISDNGASAEGGPTGSVNENKFFNYVPESLEENLAALDDLGGPKYFNHYPWGWTWAGDTPFRRWKRETYRGGISDPFIVHWPAGIRTSGEIRRHYAHAIDILPTLLEALGIEPPASIRGVAQSPIEGTSFAGTFDNAGAPERRTTQYYEMIGHRSIYHDGWKAVCPWPGPSFTEGGAFGQPISAETLRDLDARGWELYNLREDWAESRNVAADHPEVLQELITLWYIEAGKYSVLPLDGRGVERFAEPRPQITPDRKRYVYFPGTQGVPENTAVRVLNRSHVIAAITDIPPGGAEGVLLCHGGNTGGYTLFVQENRLHYIHNYVGSRVFHLVSGEEVPEGRVVLSYQFEKNGEPEIKKGKGAPGTARLYFNEQMVAEMDLPLTTPILFGLGGSLTCGRSGGSPITPAYTPPFPFTGTLHRVVVDVSGERIEDHEAEIRLALARQ